MSSLASPSSSLLPSTPLAYTIEPYSSILSISPQQDSGFFLVNNLKRIKVNGVRLYARMLQVVFSFCRFHHLISRFLARL